MIKVLTVGVYDYFHLGHLRLFENAKELGDYLIVAVQDEDFILKTKPNAKILYTTEQRKELVGALRVVDEVVGYTDVDAIVKMSAWAHSPPAGRCGGRGRAGLPETAGGRPAPVQRPAAAAAHNNRSRAGLMRSSISCIMPSLRAGLPYCSACCKNGQVITKVILLYQNPLTRR